MRKHWTIGVALAASMVGAWAQHGAATKAPAPSDLELWHQAGMSFLPPVTMFDDVKLTPEYRRYEQLRAERAVHEQMLAQMEANPTAATAPTAPTQTRSPDTTTQPSR